MKRLSVTLLCFIALWIAGCQKELSFETGGTPSEGSLQAEVTGDCLPKTVNGTYVQGVALVPGTNTITVSVNVTKSGSYLVYTDTVNGYYFRSTGLFTATGTNSVNIRGNGTPFSAGTHNFVVHYDSSICDVQVTVLPAGSGGPATFTLAGAGGSCTSAVINGSYSTGVALGVSNTVVISVNVTAVGTYNISTTATNGMTFAASGSFAATGTQTVTLQGSGTPTTSGTTTIPITAGTSTCSFAVPVSGPAAGTLGGAPGLCTTSVTSGVYMLGNPLNATNTVKIQASVSSTGGYTISSNTVTGFSFTATGNFSATGAQTVTLVGTGTPTTVGTQTFTVTWGISSCTFTITVVPIDYYPRTTGSNWSYEYDDDPTDSLLRKTISQTLSAMGNTYNIFMATDDISQGFDSSGYFRKSGGDYFEYFDVGDFIGYDNPQWVEYVMLKDNQAQGFNWKSAGYTGTATPPPPQAPVTLTIRFSYTILSKDISVPVTTSTGTFTYPNVIVIEEKYELFNGTAWQDLTSQVGYGKSYYARGVGLIKYENFDNTGVEAYHQELRRYQVF